MKTYIPEEEFKCKKYTSIKKFNNEFLRQLVDDLRTIQNDAINRLQLRWKPLLSNFEKLLLL